MYVCMHACMYACILNIIHKFYYYFFRIFPSLNYEVNIQVSPGQPHGFTITVLMLDSTLLCGYEGEGPNNRQKADAVWKWAGQVLESDK